MRLFHWLQAIRTQIRAIRQSGRRPSNLRRTARTAPTELLEARTLLAGVWDGGGATDDWNELLNWDNDQLPTAADNVVIGAAFAGDTITSSNNVTVNSLTSEASLAISGGVFTVSAGATFNNSLSLSGTANLTLGGTSTINSSLTTATGSTIRVQADGTLGTATLTVADSFTNNGAIELTAINGTGNAATLNVTSGILTNSATGTIQSLAGTGGARNLDAQLNNQGIITVAQSLTINKASADHANSGTINVSGGDLLITQSGTTPTFTNSSTGTFTITDGRTLNLSGGSFANFSDGTLTDGIYNVAGTFKFDNAAITTNAATIVLDGASSQIVNQSNSNALSGFNNNAAGGNFTITNGRNFATPSTFTNTGNLTVEAPSVFTTTSGTFNFNGGTVTGAPQIIASTLNIGVGSTGAATFSIRSSSVLTGNVASGQTILIQGDNSFGAGTLTVADSFMNSGNITLQTVAGSTSNSNLIVNSGTLTNAAGGVIDVNAGGGGSRTIAANLTNNGTVNLNTSTTFSKTGGNYTNNNAFNIASGQTLTINGSSQVFTQAGGTLAATGLFDLTSAVFNFNGGNVTGTPKLTAATLNIGNGSTGAANFSMRSSSNLTGDVAAGQTILIQGDSSNGAATLTAANGFTNAGTITLQSIADNQGATLNVSSGTLTNAGTLNINADPTVAGTRTVGANLVNNGTVNVNTNTTFSKTGGSYTNNNAFNVASGQALTINGSSQVFTQAGGTLTVDGAFNMTSATFNFNDSPDVAGASVVTGVPVLSFTTLNIGNGSTGAATFSMRGSSTFSGNIAQGQEIRIQGDSTNGSATLTAANGFTNAGTITLETLVSTSSQSNQTLSHATEALTNTATGVINVNTGTGGTRQIAANLVNNGTVNLNESTTFAKTSGSYTNNGDFNLADGETLTINGSSQAFHQNGGTLDLLGTTALFDLTSATFNFNGGTVSGTPRLTASNLNIGASSTGTATFSIRSSSNFSGNVAAGQTILVQGDGSSGAATLTATDSFTNSGNITLQTVAGSTSNSNLIVNSGTLTNAAGGVIDVNAGGGGSRTIAANLTNNGTVNLNTSTTFSKTGGNYTNNNAFNIASGQTLTINGSSQVFTQAGGTLAATGLFDLTSAVFNFNGGNVTGTPKLTAATLNIGNGSTGAANFSMRSSSNLTGDFAAGQTILIQGDSSNGAATLTAANGFTNSGTITLETVAGSTSSSNLTVNSGTLTSSGTINFNAGGGGSRTLTTELANNGIVNVNTSATLGRSSADHTNSGTINVTGGDLTVNQSGPHRRLATAASSTLPILAR